MGAVRFYYKRIRALRAQKLLPLGSQFPVFLVVKLESPELSSKRLARLGARPTIFLLPATR